MLVGGRNRMFHILLPWFIVSPSLEELYIWGAFSCLIATYFKAFPTSKGKDTCFLHLWCVTWVTHYIQAHLWCFCKCELNFLTEVSSLRTKSVCFVSCFMKLRVSKKIITLAWWLCLYWWTEARRFLGSGMPLPLLLLAKLVTHQLAPSQRVSGYLLGFSMG